MILFVIYLANAFLVILALKESIPFGKALFCGFCWPFAVLACTVEFCEKRFTDEGAGQKDSTRTKP